jgi:hypothetical protein
MTETYVEMTGLKLQCLFIPLICGSYFFYITMLWVLMVQSSLFSLMKCVITSRCKIVYSLLFFLQIMSPFSLMLLIGKPLTCVTLVCQMMAFTLSDIHIRQSHHHFVLSLLFPMVNICIVKLQMVLPTFLTLATLHFTVYHLVHQQGHICLLHLVHWKSV